MAESEDTEAPAPAITLLSRLKQMIPQPFPRRVVIVSVAGGMLLGIVLASLVAAYSQRQMRNVLQKEISELRISLDERNHRIEAQDAEVLSMSGQISTMRDFIQTSFAGDGISGTVPLSPKELHEQLLARCAGTQPAPATSARVETVPTPEPPKAQPKTKDDCLFDGVGSAEEKSAAMIRCVARLGDTPGSAGEQPASPAKNTRHRLR